MPKVSLSGMTVEALMDLRMRVDETLHKHRAELQKQLERIAVIGGGRKVVRGGGSALKGRKVPPKYRSRSGHLGGSWRKAKLACCGDQGWKEAGGFLDRQVSTQGTEETQVEALTFVPLRKFCEKF